MFRKLARWLGGSPSPETDSGVLNRLKLGMTTSDVSRLLGRPTNSSTFAGETWGYQLSDGELVVEFFANGELSKYRFFYNDDAASRLRLPEPASDDDLEELSSVREPFSVLWPHTPPLAELADSASGSNSFSRIVVFGALPLEAALRLVVLRCPDCEYLHRLGFESELAVGNKPSANLGPLADPAVAQEANGSFVDLELLENIIEIESLGGRQYWICGHCGSQEPRRFLLPSFFLRNYRQSRFLHRAFPVAEERLAEVFVRRN